MKTKIRSKSYNITQSSEIENESKKQEQRRKGRKPSNSNNNSDSNSKNHKSSNHKPLTTTMVANIKLNSSFAKNPGPGAPKNTGAGISKRGWSPGQAALFRRRSVDGQTELNDSFACLTMNDLHNDNADDEAEDYLEKSLKTIEKSDQKRSGRRSSRGRERRSKSPGNLESERKKRSSKSKNRSTMRSKSKGRPILRSKSRDRGPKTNQMNLPIEVQKRLYRVTDPDISIKEKVELEIEFMSGSPEERRMYLEFRNHFDRQGFLGWKDMTEQQQREHIEANAKEESAKEAAFQKTVDKKHQKERKKVEEGKKREHKAEKDARMHALSAIANGMSEVKSAALEAATVSVARNQFQKKQYEEGRKKMIDDFRNNEGKNMPETERVLKEALLEQEDPEEKRTKLSRPDRRR